ncbi:hypothetical protein HID58_089951 [Brassica napus]|uniref:Uncharacterized protein n=1 Tax=Brassica napus TaxID=3708 RepID=A0ABQ7Y3L3_BRANA|nr:hypothetical protein HID58_089951 [Brassica napus]
MSSAQEDLLLTTRHQMLMENHESLKQDYASLEQRFKLVEDLNAMMKPRLQNQNQSKELRLLKDLERERKEKEEYKKMVEVLEATNSELMLKNEELLTALEKQEEEEKRQEEKFDELAKKCDEIEKECSRLQSIYDDGKRLNGRQGKSNVGLEDDVFVVGESHNVVNNNNNTVDDAIVLSDESDAETDKHTRESNVNTPLRGDEEEKEGETGDGMSLDENETTKLVASDEMELRISQILDKIESFTQTVSNLLDSGKTMLKELSNEFEERLIMIHKEHVEKWQEEIKELRLLDASNEETTSLLHNARILIQNPNIDA